MPVTRTEPAAAGCGTGPTKVSIATRNSNSNSEDEQFLLRAFRSFAETAASLERSYAKLRAEVERLERELAASNGEVARSAEENARMRTQLDRILEGLPCGVLVASVDGSIQKTNPETLHILGHRPNSAKLSNLSQLSAPIQELLQRSREMEGEPEIRVAMGEEGARWLAARHAPLADIDLADTDESSVFILRDVSERKRLEEIEARMQRDQALAEISALLAHEIRNPLGSLELFAGLLAESELHGEQRDWVQHVQAGLRTLAATVNNVLQFHSQAEIERAPVDLGKLLQWAKEFFLPLARQSGTTFSVQNGLLRVTFPADRHRLEQVLLNLLLNSIRATPAGGWIELNGRNECGGNQVVIEVADTGPGISPEDLEAIFEPGFTRRSGSPGLGLTVCRNVVEQHGGSIRAANRPGAGAVFAIILPLSNLPLSKTEAGGRP